MISETSHLSSLIGSIIIKKEKKTAIFTGLSSKIFVNTDLVMLKKDQGWFSDSDGILHSWNIDGVTEQDGKVIIYGPWVEPVLLEEDYNPSVEEFTELKNFLCHLNSREENEFSRYHITKTGSGGFFQFPPRLMKELIRQKSDRSDFTLRQFGHPDIRGDKAFSFALALIQFRMITGHYPWIETEDEAMNHEIRERDLPRLQYYFKPEESTRFVSLVLSKGTKGPELNEWLKYTPVEPCTPSEEWEKEMQKSYKRFYQKRYALKHRIKLIALGSAVALTLFIMIKVILNILAPPFTEGMTQKEVVELYYESWGEMDVTTVDNLVLRKSQVDTQDNLDFMYVTTKVQESTYAGIKTYSPEEWLESGKEELEPFETIFGISDLELKDLGFNQFEAVYHSWYPPDSADPDEEQVYKPTVILMTEVVTLVEHKGAWFIGRVEVMEKVLADYP